MAFDEYPKIINTPSYFPNDWDSGEGIGGADGDLDDPHRAVQTLDRSKAGERNTLYIDYNTNIVYSWQNGAYRRANTWQEYMVLGLTNLVYQGNSEWRVPWNRLIEQRGGELSVDGNGTLHGFIAGETYLLTAKMTMEGAVDTAFASFSFKNADTNAWLNQGGVFVTGDNTSTVSVLYVCRANQGIDLRYIHGFNTITTQSSLIVRKLT